MTEGQIDFADERLEESANSLDKSNPDHTKPHHESFLAIMCVVRACFDSDWSHD